MSGTIRKVLPVTLLGVWVATIAVAQPGPTAETQLQAKTSPQARDIFYRLGAPAEAGKTQLGLRYQIQLFRGDDVTFVPTAFEFKTGDRFRLLFQPNADGYVYIFHRGSSGRGHVLFPHPRIYGGENRVPAYKDYVIPPTGWFRFDETAGTEQLFVFFSPKPVKELERTTTARSLSRDILSSTVAQVLARRRQSAEAGDVIDVEYTDDGQTLPPSGTGPVALTEGGPPTDVGAEPPTVTGGGPPAEPEPQPPTVTGGGPPAEPEPQPPTEPGPPPPTVTGGGPPTEPEPQPPAQPEPQPPTTTGGGPPTEIGTGVSTSSQEGGEATTAGEGAVAQPGAVVVMYAGCVVDEADGLLIHVIRLTHR